MPVATLIGDLVRSRRSPDRAAVHARLVAVLEQVNRDCSPAAPLQVTAGDEYQGTFATVGTALRATLRLRLALLPLVDARHGVGWGEVSVLQERPRVEDGPGWWAAREAIQAVESAEGRAATRSRRTGCRLADGVPAVDSPDVATVEALLMLRDQMVSGLSERSLSVLRGLLAGSTQREVADGLDITPSAVSQRVRADGLAAILASDEQLEGAR